MADREASMSIPPASRPWLRTFAALRHRNYRLFFVGQLISLCGTWMQGVAQPWFVYEMTQSKLKLAIVSVVSSLPVLALSFLSGVAADRYPKRTILFFTQACLMTSALLFWALIVTGHISYPLICALALLSGTAMAFDIPVRQSFVIEMVGKEDLMNAITLNSSMFNLSRVIGPSIAGVVITSVGIANCFLLNGLSFIAVIVAIYMMNVPARVANGLSDSLWENIRAGIEYARRQPVIRTTLILSVFASAFGASYMVLLPVFAKDVFHAGPRAQAFLMAASGGGAVVGALGLASLGDVRRKGILLLCGAVVFAVAIGTFGCSQWMAMSLVCLVIAGASMTTYRSLCNTLCQTTVPDDMRGRVMALFTLAFAGVSPVGNFQAGLVAQYISVHVAVVLGAAIVGLSALIVLLTVPEMRKA